MNDTEFVNMIFNDWDENLCDNLDDSVRCQQLRYFVLGVMTDTDEGRKLFNLERTIRDRLIG